MSQGHPPSVYRSIATSSFTPAALSLLADVAAGTADALVGDDVAEGIVRGATPNAVVVVDHWNAMYSACMRCCPSRTYSFHPVAATGHGSS